MPGLRYFCWLAALVFSCAFSTGSSIKEEKAAAITLGDLFRAGAPVFDSLQWNSYDSIATFPGGELMFDSATVSYIDDRYGYNDQADPPAYQLFFYKDTLRQVKIRTNYSFDLHVFYHDSLAFISVSAFYKSKSGLKRDSLFRLNKKCMIVHFLKSDRFVYFGTENGIQNPKPVFTSFLDLWPGFVARKEIRFQPATFPCKPQFIGWFQHTDINSLYRTRFNAISGDEIIGLETPVSKVFGYLAMELKPPYTDCEMENLKWICDPYWWIKNWTYDCTTQEGQE